MSKPVVYELRWNKFSQFWGLYRNEAYRAVAFYPDMTKNFAIKCARVYVRTTWARDKRPCQLLIKNKDGKIGKGGQAEASYGCDSVRRRG